MGSMNIAEPEIDDELNAIDISEFISSAELGGMRVEKQEALGLDARNMDIQESKIIHIVASESSFQGLSMKDVLVDSSNLTASRISDSKLVRVVFKSCRLQGAGFSSSDLSDVIFEDCNLDLSNFNMATLRDVVFRNCSLNESSFVSSKQKNVTYENCTIEKIDIADTRAQNVILSSSQIYNVGGIASLKGFTLDMSQVNVLAPEFAATLGIKIK